MTWDDVNRACNEARDTFNLIDSIASRMARLLAGRLRHVDTSILRQLKRELQGFDSQKRIWR